MQIKLPELSLVVLIGCSGSGKSTFARRLFKPTEVLSSDFCRALVSDDENDQSATNDAFDALHFIAAKRLARGLLTVVDATNVQPDARKPLVALAREHDVLPVAIVLDLPERLAPTDSSGGMSSATNRCSCVDQFAVWRARGFGTSSCCDRPSKSMPPS
jgi:protein phosphatase